MKVIHLIRHGKSSWDDYALADIDRPLKQRGIKSCEIMAPRLLQSGCNFNNIYCSPARRAQQTIQLISQNIPGRNITWKTEDELYTFSSEDLLNWLRSLDDDLDEVTLVGHNPGMTDLNNYLTANMLDNLPTCGYLQLRSLIDTWAELEAGCSIQAEYLTPKQLKS